jgi:hypothetical protein
MNEIDIIKAHLPESVKQAITTHQMHKLAELVTGLDDFSIEKISQYMGGRTAARHMKWRPVAEGLTALAQLRK